MPNRLIDETSPYLLQHAHNPVEWYPWGDEALARAQEEDKPILLSIGYSACHWCHVMERESFENDDIAALMNEHFINIKVDREERPDLDAVYMEAVHALTGSGGWPMTVFLTPDGRPFYGGTYFPPEDRGNMPGFPRLVEAISDAYRTRRGEVLQSINQLMGHLGQSARMPRSLDPLINDTMHRAYQALAPAFDHELGGFGNAPKFPQPMIYEFLLRYHRMSNNPRALEMAEATLQAMARGGMYDQVGGGFHRYSTDRRWLVPHFEKMLYDNALLARLYLHAFQATGDPAYRRVATEILDYVVREMTDSAGGFYSSQDADSEGEEGKFFVWTLEELAEVLGPEEGELVAAYFGASQVGNFEGSNILYLPHDADEFATAAGLSSDQLEGVVQSVREKLLEARETRVHPARDDKVLAGWNGLMLQAFAEAAAVLDRDDYRRVAIDNATFILREMRPDGRLLRSYKDGQARVLGYLEDYAFVADGLLYVYELTFDRQWINEARALADDMIDLFWDEDLGFFYETGKDAEQLVVRPRELFDNAIPCGGSMAAHLLQRLSIFTGEQSYGQKAATTLRGVQNIVAEHPMGMGNWLAAIDFYVTPVKEVVVIGPQADSATRGLLETVHAGYLPNKVVAGGDGTEADPSIPLLEGRGLIDGRPAAYVCQNYTCQLPVTAPADLLEQLNH